MAQKPITDPILVFCLKHGNEPLNKPKPEEPQRMTVAEAKAMLKKYSAMLQ